MLGAALWPEAVVPDGGRLIRALAARARRAGATLIEEIEVRDVVTDGGRVAGVLAARPGDPCVQRFSAPVIVNAAGPEAGALALRADPSGKFAIHPVMGFNLLIDRPPPAEVALALTPPGGEAMLFLQPDRGTTFAGTWYAPAGGGGDGRAADAAAGGPDSRTIDAFIAAIRSALPGFAPTRRDVAEVTVGFLPGAGGGGTALMRRDVIHDHGMAGGPRGLFSVAGIKYTTAGAVAREVLTRARRSGVIGGAGKGFGRAG
jgi:glycerol-3-phosphate dehydrogenase